MPSRLEEIIARTLQDLPALEDHAAKMREITRRRTDFRQFRSALEKAHPPALIAEVKQASPSAGLIAKDFDPLKQAKDYANAGARAISVVTEPHFFKGSTEHLHAVRETVSLPILRKDFTLHRHHLYQAGAIGADAVLLIVAALEPPALYDLYHEARDLQFDVLVEVHDERELDIALNLGSDLIGINNRNLATFQVNIETTLTLAARIPQHVLIVSESGIKTREDVERILSVGARAILVGETLMRAASPVATIHELLAIDC